VSSVYLGGNMRRSVGNITDLKYGLLDYLKQEMEPYGFRKSRQSFYKRITIGRQIFHVAFIPYKYNVEINAYVDIRHEEIEKLDKIILGEAYDIETATIGAELGLLANSNSKIWSLNDRSLIPVVGIDIMDTFWRIGWPFLDEYASLEKIYDVLISDDLPISDYLLIDHVRAEKALIAAFLLNRNDIEMVIDKKLSYLLRKRNPYLKDFLNFVVSFKKMIVTP
jgi:hypothetical protein